MSWLTDEDIRDRRFSIDELVAVANRLLPRVLPAELNNSKLREVVNSRLVRNLATLGLIDEPLKEGREARYLRRHLLQLLVTRRLMAQGYTTGAIKKLITGAPDDQLESILQGGAHLTVAPGYTTPNPSILLEDVQALSRESQVTSNSSMAPPDQAAPKRLRDERLHEEQSNTALRYLQRIRESESKSAPAARLSAPSVPMASLLAPPALTGEQPSSLPLPYVRIEVQPGLELHVSEEFELPLSSHERDLLLQQILNELKRIQNDRGRRRRRTH